MAKRKRIGSGVVTSINEHHKGEHLQISVAHGQKAKPKKDAFSYDDRPTSTLVVPKSHADRYHVGQEIDIAASPTRAGESSAAGGNTDRLARVKKSAASGLLNATHRR